LGVATGCVEDPGNGAAQDCGNTGGPCDVLETCATVSLGLGLNVVACVDATDDNVCDPGVIGSCDGGLVCASALGLDICVDAGLFPI
jgi:hypothetical protein